LKRSHAILLVVSAAAVMLAGCGPIRLIANTNIPAPLVVKIPVGVALFIPKEFSQYVHREERWSTDWNVELGKAQSEGITRLLNAMFERVVLVDSVNEGAQAEGIRAILEPSIEEYAFVTPRDAGSPFFAVSIKYRVNIYFPDGKLADSWGFTGYGTSPAQGLSSEAPLAAATALAMRDAGAKLAVEFREQAIVRGLLPASETADTPPPVAPSEPPATRSEAESSQSPPGPPSEPESSQSPPAGAPTSPPEPAEAPVEEPPKQEAPKPEPEAFTPT
jgi:hypothetical protein